MASSAPESGFNAFFLILMFSSPFFSGFYGWKRSFCKLVELSRSDRNLVFLRLVVSGSVRSSVWLWFLLHFWSQIQDLCTRSGFSSVSILAPSFNLLCASEEFTLVGFLRIDLSRALWSLVISGLSRRSSSLPSVLIESSFLHGASIEAQPLLVTDITASGRLSILPGYEGWFFWVGR